jgi:Mrp family chromosome partitioning ATPase
MLDGVIFVTDAGNTRIPAARDAAMRLAGVGSRILGTVLNNVDLERRSGAGYYGYQYYYYRGSYYYGETTDQAAS